MESSMESMATTPRARCLTVRFEDSCVLIPPSEPFNTGLKTRLFRRSYSLPLWKTTPSKKTTSLTPNPITNAESDALDEPKLDKKAFSLTVSVPSLTPKPSPRRPSPPSSPCLSKRIQSKPTSPVLPLASRVHDLPPPPRMPNFPAVQPAIAKDGEMVPLRPCCEACHTCVDASLAQGESWAEKWSSGAKRRHSEGENTRPRSHSLFGYACELSAARPDVALPAALRVDEMEVRRRASKSHGVICADEVVLEDSDEDSKPSPVLPPPVRLEEEEDTAFPLSSPWGSPQPSPHATPPLDNSFKSLQTSLDAAPTSMQADFSIPAPRPRPPSPIMPASAVASSQNRGIPMASLTGTPPPPTRPPPQRVRAPGPSSSSSSSSSRQPPTPSSTPKQRRPSFSSASGSFLKSSAEVLRGVAVGMTSVSVGVVR